MLAFCSLLGKIGSKGVIPDADIFGGFEKCVHIRVYIIQLVGLVSGMRKPGKGQELVRRNETRESIDFSKDCSTHMVADTGNCENG